MIESVSTWNERRSWRNDISGHTRRMVERATVSIAMGQVRLISPPSPPTPKPSAEDLALRAERDEEARQRDIFFNKMDWITSNFGRTFWYTDAGELIANPSQVGFAYNMGSFPSGEKRIIEIRTGLDTSHIDESYEIARIKLARKLLDSGGTHGANYTFNANMFNTGNEIWMSAVPVFLDYG